MAKMLSRLIRTTVALAGAALALFHGWLFAAQAAAGRLDDPWLIFRWAAAVALVGALIAVRRGGDSIWGRKGVAIWVMAALLHGPAVAGKYRGHRRRASGNGGDVGLAAAGVGCDRRWRVDARRPAGRAPRVAARAVFVSPRVLLRRLPGRGSCATVRSAPAATPRLEVFSFSLLTFNCPRRSLGPRSLACALFLFLSLSRH